jgi:hypothetical protein
MGSLINKVLNIYNKIIDVNNIFEINIMEHHQLMKNKKN